MIHRSMTPRHLGYSAVTHLTLLGLIASMLFLLGGRTYAATSPDGQAILQPLVRIASDAPINYDSGTHHFACQSPTTKVICYGPSQMRKAYNIQPLLDDGVTGKNATIVILDAFQAPNIQEDLSTFDQTFGLNDTGLNIIAPDGLTPFDPTNAVHVIWSLEISLDVEWAHAIAPDATIDLVLAKSSEERDLLSALNHAIDKDLGDVISMSFGINEPCMGGQQLWHEAFRAATSKDITLLASSGDTGAAQESCDSSTSVKEVLYPAVDPFVTAVGGTQLHADPSTGEYHNEVAWNEPQLHAATGGGFSTNIPKPFYQNPVNSIGKYRGIPDVSYDAAAADGGVIYRWSEAPKGANFYIVGGTSAGSPQWAGIVALAIQYGKNRIGMLNPTIYSSDQMPHYSSNFHDVTSGNNSVTLLDANKQPVTIEGYSASPGWDPTTGWGSPQAATLVPYLASHNALTLSSSDLASL